jgi:hypothetical protein
LTNPLKSFAEIDPPATSTTSAGSRVVGFAFNL